jgi:DNA polymerase-1
VFGVPYDDIVKAKKIDGKVKGGELPVEARTAYVKECLAYRSYAKSIGFGLNYGMKENKLAKQIDKSVEEAKELMEAYMARYPAVAHFYHDAIEETRSTGYAFTVLGRRRYLPEIQSTNSMDRWKAERQAVNMQIQGTAADVVRLAMINIDASSLLDDYGVQMCLQVHDELVFECPEECTEEAMPKIQALMEHALHGDLAVPLDVSIGSGKAWSKAK